MRHVLGDAGIVDQRVKTAPRFGRGDDLPAVLVAGHIALDHDHVGTGGAAEIGGRFGLLLAGGIVDHDARPAFRQNGCGRGPQTGRRTRYDRAQTILRHPHFLLLIFQPVQPSRRSTISCSKMPANRQNSIARN
jgi:hypothetical protein